MVRTVHSIVNLRIKLGQKVETRNCRCWLTKKGQSAGVTVIREHPWRTWVGDVSGQDPSSNPWTKVDRK